jgi:hypothetical protein
MANVAKNWFCITLACLLGIAPLGRALAEVHSPLPPQHNHSMMGSMSHDGHHTHQEMAAQQCKSCTSSHACDSHDCPCSQCASCITPLLPTLLDIHFNTLSQDIPAGDHGLAIHLPSLLFRPPRS